MNYDELDRILSQEEEFIPSPGFVQSVMGAVRVEAAAYAIPFPWKCAWPGIAAWVIAIGFALVAGIAFSSGQSPATEDALSHTWVLFLQVAKRTGLGWVTLALLMSLVSVKFSDRLLSRTT